MRADKLTPSCARSAAVATGPRHSLDGAAVAREGRKMLSELAFDMDFDMDDPTKSIARVGSQCLLGSAARSLHIPIQAAKIHQSEDLFDPKWFEFQKISDQDRAK